MDNLVMADPADCLGRDAARLSPFFRDEFAAGLRTFGLIMLTAPLPHKCRKELKYGKPFRRRQAGKQKFMSPA
jgi:hypothetical protein